MWSISALLKFYSNELHEERWMHQIHFELLDLQEVNQISPTGPVQREHSEAERMMCEQLSIIWEYKWCPQLLSSLQWTNIYLNPQFFV